MEPEHLESIGYLKSFDNYKRGFIKAIKGISYFLFLFMICVLTESSSFGIDLFDIKDVKKNDTLSLRERADYRSKKVGQIPYNQKRIFATDNQQKLGTQIWYEVKYNGVTGWVNGKYLAKSRGISFNEDLKCFGMEPYWSVDIIGESLVLRDIDEAPTSFILTKVDLSSGYNNEWYISADSGKNSSFRAFIIKTGKCSDSMSDNDHQYEIHLHDEVNQQTLSGCCNVK